MEHRFLPCLRRYIKPARGPEEATARACEETACDRYLVDGIEVGSRTFSVRVGSSEGERNSSRFLERFSFLRIGPSVLPRPQRALEQEETFEHLPTARANDDDDDDEEDEDGDENLR